MAYDSVEWQCYNCQASNVHWFSDPYPLWTCHECGLPYDVDEEYDDDTYDYEEWRAYDDEIYDFGFADPGGRSALRAAGPDNPRNQPCPTCGTENVLTPADVRLGYQCDRCADGLEGRYGSEY